MSSCSRAASADTGRAGATAGSASRSGSARPRCASASATSAARALLDASSETVAAIGAWCDDNGVDAWFDQSGYLCVSTGAGVRRRGPRRRRGRRGARQAGRGARPDRGARSASGATRPCSGGGVLVPDFATVQPARLALGLRERLIERGVEIFEHSRVRLRLRGCRLGRGATDSGGRCAPAPPCSRSGPAARSFRPLRSRLSVTSSHIVLTEPVPDVIERDRLDRRRVHHRRPHAPPLLPHHARRPDRVRLGRRAAGLRRARERPRSRWTREVAADGAPAPAADLPGARGPRGSPTPGAGRSTSRRATSPRSARCLGRPCTSRFGFTGNGVGPTHLAGRALAVARARPARPLDQPPARRLASAGAWVPPEPLAWLGGNARPAARSCAARTRYERGERPGPLTRALCAVPRALGIHVAR